MIYKIFIRIYIYVLDQHFYDDNVNQKLTKIHKAIKVIETIILTLF